MTILFSAICRGPNVILCSHQVGLGEFEQITMSMLRNIQSRSDGRTTYTSDTYLFHVVVENGIIYLCVADSDFGRRQPYAYLEEIKNQFFTAGLTSKAHFGGFGELNPEFSNTLEQQMEKYSQPGAGGGDQISVLQRQVDDVKGVMTQNIEKVLERGDKLEDLMTKTDDLEAHANTFKKTARKVHRKMFWKNAKMTICVVGVSLLLILVIVLIILFSTGVLPPKSDDSTTTTTTTTTTTVATK